MEEEQNINFDILDVPVDRDGDVFESECLPDIYQQPYFCSSRKAVALHSVYVLQLDCHWEQKHLACVLSNGSVLVLDSETLKSVESLPVQNKSIFGVHHAPDNGNILFTGSNEGIIRSWDMRAPKKPTHEFKDDVNGTVKPILSFDLNCNGKFVCAGTEQIKEDSFLLFWDVRTTKLLGGYWESHEDDITHVRFHPNEPDTLASCSTDGLINIFDLSESDEDNALQFSLNSEASCSHLSWLHGNGVIKTLSVVTHTEDIQIWDVEQASINSSFSRDDIKTALKRKQAENCYVVDCFQYNTEEDSLILAGSRAPSSGCLRILRQKNNTLSPYSNLDDPKGNNSQVVRCALFHPITCTLITGGEDGIINVWKEGNEVEILKPAKMSKNVSKHKKKPYDK